jgi:general secretion pathway protein C
MNWTAKYPIELLFTKHFWIVNLITLALVAYFLASGTSELIAASLMGSLPSPYESPVQGLKKLRPPRRKKIERKSGRAILERNIFDSTVGPIDPDGRPDEPAKEDPDEPDELSPCDESNLKLLATVVSDSDDRWSFASLSEGQETRLHRVGDKVGDQTVAGITWRYLFLEEESDLCFLDLFGESNLAKHGTKTSPQGRKRSRTNGRLQKGVKILGNNERVVDRQIVNEVMANPTKFSKNVRFRPERKNGRIIGYKLRRMRRGGPLSLLGLKRRDVIKEINGVALTSMDKVIKAYQGLSSADEIRFSVNRKGRPLELKVRVQ